MPGRIECVLSLWCKMFCLLDFNQTIMYYFLEINMSIQCIFTKLNEISVKLPASITSAKIINCWVFFRAPIVIWSVVNKGLLEFACLLKIFINSILREVRCMYLFSWYAVNWRDIFLFFLRWDKQLLSLVYNFASFYKP